MSLSDLQSRIAVIISADGQGAIKEIQKVGQAADRDLGKATSNIDKLGNRLTYGGAAAMGFAALAGGALYSFAKASDEAYQYEVKLQNSMANSPKLANTNIKAFKDLAQAIQAKTAADGDMILGSMAVLAQFGLTESQIKTLTPLVVDYSRKMGVDLDIAAKNVAKALDGKATALQKSGIKIDENVYKTDKLAAVTNALRGTVGGFAEQEGQTFSGKLERLKNQMNDLKESIGAGVISTVGPLLNSFGQLAQGASNVDEKTGGMVGKLSSIGVGVTGAIGALSFLSGQFIKLRSQMLDAEGGLTSFGKATRAIGVAGAVFAIGEVLAEGVKKINEYSIATEKLRRDVETFAATGTKTGEIKKLTDDYKELAWQINIVASNESRYQRLRGEGISGGGSPDFGKFADLLTRTSLDDSRKNLDKLDKSLAQLVDSGNSARARQLFEELSAAAAKGGAKQELLTKTLDDYRNALENVRTRTEAHNKIVEQSAQNLDDEAQAMRWGNLAIEDRLALQDKLASGSLSLELATLRLDDKYAEFNKKIVDGTFKGNEQRESQLELIQTASDLARKTGELDAAQRGLTDKADVDARTRIVQVATLEAMKQKFPELAGEIDNHIRLLQSIPTNVTTTVNANYGPLDEAIRRFERLQSLATDGTEVTFHVRNANVGFRAAGGPIVAGQAYIVGERGPELMVPNANGTVIPNSALRAYNPETSTYNISVSVGAGAHPADVGAEVVSAIKAYERRNGATWRGAA